MKHRAPDGEFCTYCGLPAQVWDHIVPKSAGGGNDATNLTPACHACNGAKRAMSVLRFLLWKKTGGIVKQWFPVTRISQERAAYEAWLSSMGIHHEPEPWELAHALSMRYPLTHS